MDRVFTVEEARELLPSVIAGAEALIAARADMAEIAHDRRAAGASPLGGIPELKALEARIEEILSGWMAQGIEIKSVAPVLVDFPAVLDWLRRHDYNGWIVVEQDVLPGMGTPKESARRNREYLASLGL